MEEEDKGDYGTVNTQKRSQWKEGSSYVNR